MIEDPETSGPSPEGEPRQGQRSVEPIFGHRGPRSALTVLSRLVQRKPETRPMLETFLGRHLGTLAETALDVVMETGASAGDVLADVLETRAGFDLAERLLVRFEGRPYRTSPALRRCGLAVTRKVLDVWEARGSDTVERAAKLCYLWHNLCSWLEALGQSEAATSAAERALAWSDILAERTPRRYRLRRAICLGTYAARLAAAGRITEALEPRSQAITILRDLTGETPEDDDGTEHLSRLLLQQSIAYKELRRFEQALLLAREAVEIRARLTRRSVSLEREHVNSLDHLARCLSACGLEPESLEAAREAARICERLANERPSSFATDVARSLSNLSIAERTAGHLDSSLEASHAALWWIERAKREWDHLPAGLEQYRASILVNEGLTLLRAGKPERALEVLADTVEARRALTADGLPQAWDRLALALANRSAILLAMDRNDEALASLDEAIAIRGRLAAEEPDVYAEGLRRNRRVRERLAGRRSRRASS